MPTHAVTVTIPGLYGGGINGLQRAPQRLRLRLVRDMLDGQVSERCPASILTTHRDAVLYLDRESANYVL